MQYARNVVVNNILRRASKIALREAIEANLIEQNRFWGSSPKSEFHDGKDLIWFITGYPVSVLNAISGAKISGKNIDAVIEETLKHFEKHHVPTTWWVGPSTRPENLGEYLEQHGFEKTLEMPGMTIDLSTLDTVEYPDDFSIMVVSNENRLRTWADTQSKGFGGSQDQADIFFEFEKSLGMNPHSQWLRFVGLLNDEPVAVSILFLGAGVAAIFNVAVVPEWRRQGFGTLITREPLLRARSMGYRYGVLKATPMGTRLYQKMEFEEC